MSTFERNEGISKISWVNDMVIAPKTAADLTSTYAEDVLHAVEDKEFPTLRAAIDDLAGRVGLGEVQKEELRKVASLKYNPKLLTAMENVENLGAEDIEQALDAYSSQCKKCSNAPCSCGYAMSPTMKQAMEEYGINKLMKKLAFSKYEPTTKIAMATAAEIAQIWKDAPMNAIIILDAYTKGSGYYKDEAGVSRKVPPHVKTGEKLRKGVPGKMGGELKGTGYGKEGDDTPQNKINGYSMACAANAMSIVDDAEREQTLKRCHRSYLIDYIIKIEYNGKIWDFRKDHSRDPEDGDNPAETLNHEPGGMTYIDAESDEPVPPTFRHPSKENRWKAPSTHKHYKDLTDEEMQEILNKDNEEGGAAASAKAIYLQKIAGADFKKIKQIKEELGCSQGEAMKEYWKRERSKRDSEPADGEVTLRKRDKKEDKGEEKEEKKDKKDKKDKEPKEDKKDKKEPKEDKKEKDMDAKASNKQKWGEFFKKKGWFQGNDEPTKEGDITANDPAKIGYPKDMEYKREPMAVPVGQDARPWEQKWFENAADETAKDMGPSGAELKEKKELQRASWKAFLEKKASEKK